MKTIDLIQGSPEWHSHRATHDNASDAPAMDGCSPYKTRTEFLQERFTGITKEVDAATQRRFDDGHRYEALARKLAEEIIGEDLFPVTGVSDNYSASFDGITMAEDITFEHKTLNDSIRDCSSAEELPRHYRIQMEHQLMVSGAEKCLFMASKWDSDDSLTEEKHFWYLPDPALRAELIAGWKQFYEDLENFKPVEFLPAAVAAHIDELPILSVSLVGQVSETNLPIWKSVVAERIKAINTDLQTDDDFATADKMVKFLDDGEKRIDLVKSQALAQTSSIDELFRTLDSLKGEMRTKRLELDRLVKARKESIRIEIASKGKDALADHVVSLNKRLGKSYMPIIAADFAGAIKGKRTIASLRDAVDTELARAKIAANEIADRIDLNLKTLRELAMDHAHLFPDTSLIVQKANDDLISLIKARIAEENERIAKVKAAAEAKAKAEAEAAEAQRKAEEERKAAEATQLAAPASPAADIAPAAPAQAWPETTPAFTPAATVAPEPVTTAPAAWQAAYDRTIAALEGMTIAQLALVEKYARSIHPAKAAA